MFAGETTQKLFVTSIVAKHPKTAVDHTFGAEAKPMLCRMKSASVSAG
jgi:hypothetical protein